MTIRCTVGVMVHNEEDNIVAVLEALLVQQLTVCELLEIVVVASGCTDATVERASEIGERHSIVRVIAEPERTGKASAISQLIRVARGDVIILVGADTLPDHTAVDHLTRPFADPSVGMTGARVVPVNPPDTFMGFAVHLLWRIHHRMASRWPKLGELVAFRNVIEEVPSRSATDEVALEALITAKQYRLVYTPAAVIFNHGPTTLRDFLMQRRRIFAGHLEIAARYGYVAASMSPIHLVVLVREVSMRYLAFLPWIVAAIVLESWARLLGTIDFVLGSGHHIWRSVRSTKKISQRYGPLRIAAVVCEPDSLQPGQLVRAMRRIPAGEGALLWWSQSSNEMLFRLPSANSHVESVDQCVKRLMCFLLDSDVPAVGPPISYRIVDFALDERRSMRSDSSYDPVQLSDADVRACA